MPGASIPLDVGSPCYQIDGKLLRSPRCVQLLFAAFPQFLCLQRDLLKAR